MRTLIRPICFLVALAATVRAVDVPAVPTFADQQAFAVVVIPDLPAALGRIDQAMAASKLPVPPGIIAMQLGGALGDPTLAGFAGKPILIAVGPGVPIPAWCAIVPVANDAALKGLATMAGASVEAVPGGFAIGSMVGGLELAKRLAPALPALAKAVPAGTDLRLMVAADRLMQTYLPLMLMGLQQAMAMQPQEGVTALDQQKRQQAVSVFLRLFANQAGPACIDIASSAQGWRFDAIAAPAPGVLADGIKPMAGAAPDLGLRLGAAEQPPVMACSGRFPPTVYLAFAKLLGEARKDPVIAGMVDEALVNVMSAFASSIDGNLAMRQGVPGNPFQQLGVLGVTDAAALRQAMAAGFAFVEKGAFADLLATSGLKMRLERGVRKAGAVEVDRLVQEVIPEAMPPAQADMMKAMLKPSEFAISKDLMVMGAPSAAVDALLAGPAAKPLRLAAAAIPGQWDLRMDYDLALQMKYQFEMMRAQMPMMPAMFTDMKGGVPVRVAVAFGAGRVRVVSEVPAELIAQVAASWAAAMPRQGVRGGRPQPEPMPAPAPPSTF